jgi:hypothetical protein
VEPIRQRWDDIVQKVKTRKISLGTFLARGTPVHLAKNVLTVAFAKGDGFSVEKINKDCRTISEILGEEIGKPYVLKCIIDETQEAVGNSPSTEPSPQRPVGDAEHLYEKEPIIKKIIDVFDGQFIQE